MIFEDVPDHEDASASSGKIHKVLSILDLQCERLLDKDVFASLEGSGGKLVMANGRCGDGNSVDMRIR